MGLEERKNAFIKLGDTINSLLASKAEQGLLAKNYVEKFKGVIQKAEAENGWFTKKNLELALKAIANSLSADEINQWIKQYETKDSNKLVGVVMAGNIPLAGFHDAMCVLLSGNKLCAKLSSDDKVLLPFFLLLLEEIEPEFQGKYQIVDKIKDVEAVIATGSNNSARYFEYYFSKYPHIIRKNRSSVAILTGNESEEEMNRLGDDIFSYFGLGCRSISKLFLPKDYDFDLFFKGIYHCNQVINHNKYANNYDYNRAIYLMNKDDILDNGFLLLKNDTAVSSPLGVVFYEFYNANSLSERLEMDKENIQCIVGEGYLPFGAAQFPAINDYADGIDTMEFLQKL